MNQEGNSATAISTTPIEKWVNMEQRDPLSSPSLPIVSVYPSELLFNHKTTSSLSTSSAVSQNVSVTNHAKGKIWYVNLSGMFCSPNGIKLSGISVEMWLYMNTYYDFLEAWCGLLSQIPPFALLPLHLSWPHWSLPPSEWRMNRNRSTPCMGESLSALHTIR